jgi:hypothetical protein
MVDIRLAAFIAEAYIFIFFYKTCYLNEEVNCIESSPEVSVPWYQLCYLLVIS